MTKPMTESEFYERFTCTVKDEQGWQVWEYDELQARHIPTNRVWSLMDGDCGTDWASPGYHIVNVYGYLVTDEPWTDEMQDVQFDTDPVCSRCGLRKEDHDDDGEEAAGPHTWEECE